MNKFNGFTSSETFTSVPDTFFRELLSQIDDAEELRATLHAIWRIEHMEGSVRFLRRADFGAFAAGVDKAVSRGSLLKVENEAGEFFFLNSPRGRAAAEAFAKGQWRESARITSAPPIERPNVFKLYEENIGPLTPLIADALKDAEQSYSEAWVAEAIEIAVKRNIRNLKYIEAILRRWKENGKDERKDQQDAVKGFDRYTEGEFAEYLKRD